MFGTDLPSTIANESFSNKHLEMIKDNLTEKDNFIEEGGACYFDPYSFSNGLS